MNINNWTPNKVLVGTAKGDYFSNKAAIVTIQAGAGNDNIDNSGAKVTIDAGDGKDEIYNTGDDVTISAGNGNDYVYNGYEDMGDSPAKNILVYLGDGNDRFDTGEGSRNKPGSGTIIGGNGDDTIEVFPSLGVTGGAQHPKYFISYTYGDGNDIIENFGKNDTLQIATEKSFETLKSDKDFLIIFDNGEVLTLRDYDTKGLKNIVTVSGGNTDDGDDDGGDDDGGDDEEKNSWKLNDTIATYGTSSKTLATVKGAKSVSGLSTSDKKITLKNTALSKKVTVRGSYEFDFASNYKNATISGTAKADTITARGKNLKIVGGKGKDSIKMVGTGQTLSGGAGADTFIYAANGGNEKILDFKSNDKLKIGEDGDGNYSTVTSGDNLIVSTDDGGKITLVGATNLSNVDIVGTKKTSGKGVKVSGNGKKITLTENFEDNSFSLSGKYSSAVTLDASEVLLDLSITGNNFSNRIIGTAQDDTIDGGAGADTIYGGDGNDSIFGGKGNDIIFGGIGKDTLWGGAGDDELYGDDGKDVFYCNAGEGNDTIFGYEASVDKIILVGGTISNVTTDRNNNVIFSVGDGQIVVNNCADRTVKIVNSSGNIVKNGLYEP